MVMEAVTLTHQLVCCTSQLSRKSVGDHQSATRAGNNVIGSNLHSLLSSFSKGEAVLSVAKRHQRTERLSSQRSRECSASCKGREKLWKEKSYSKSSPQVEEDNLLKRLSRAVSCTLATGVVLLNSALPASAEGLTVTFPGSKVGEVSVVQRTLVEAWGIVRETYVDPSFNHQDWDLTLQDSLADTLNLENSDDAYSKIRAMLASLGDPFTRLITPKEYESFRINNDGALEGVGLLIASERDTGRLIVMSPLEGGPAARAGIVSGDELVEIDDELLSGMNGEEAATKLRGRAGTSVTIKLRRSFTEGAEEGGPQITEIKLQRETISLSPVYSTVLSHPAPDGHVEKTGYIRLSTFSQNAATEMERAIGKLENQGVESYILDLRNNPGAILADANPRESRSFFSRKLFGTGPTSMNVEEGGLVKAGLDVAQMWLDGNEVLVNTIDREGDTQPITLVNGHALTRDPLAVLVNEGSASASEILAGALHDNGRAVLLGQQTYGKGKIQSVTQLRDGSALFVTVAKYLSPSLHQIDQVGIAPDLKCNPDDLSAADDTAFPPAKNLQEELRNAEQTGLRMLQRDSCIIAAEDELDKIIT